MSGPEATPRILYLSPGVFDKGGVSRYCRHQIQALRSIVGHDNVRVFSVLGPDADSLEDPIDVAYAAGGVSASQKASFMARAAADVVLHRPSLIHAAHLNLAGAAELLARVFTAGRARTVVNLYGYEAWSPMRWDMRVGLETAAFVMADCHYTARYLEEKGYRPKGSVDVAWDCVDTDRFSPKEPSREVLARYGIPDPSKGVNLLTLGRLMKIAEYKGYAPLLDAFARVAPEVPDLTLIYGGRGDLVEPLRARAKELGLASRVVFTGSIHERDLADVYRSGHIFSLVGNRGVGQGEGLPLTPIEAASCGVPILVGNQDGSMEAVEHEVTGAALDPGDPGALAAWIGKLARDPELRAQMGNASRRRVEELFSAVGFEARHRALLARWQRAPR